MQESIASDEEVRDPAWKWAYNDGNLGVIKNAVNDYKKQMTPFMRRWCTEDPTKIKMQIGEDQVKAGLTAFTSTAPQLNTLCNTVDQLNMRRQSVCLNNKAGSKRQKRGACL